MSIKKVAIIVKYFPTVSETFIVNQMNSLIDAGIEVNIYAYQKLEETIIHRSLKKHDLLNKTNYFVKPSKSKITRLLDFIKWIIQHSFRIKWTLLFKTLNIFKFGKDAYTLKLFFEAQWFLIPYDFKLIHVHFGMNGNRIAYLKAKGIIPQDVKLINTFHGYDLMPNKLNSYLKEYSYLLKESHAFTVNTEYLRNLLKQINVFGKPCNILPVGLDTKYFNNKFNKTNKPYFDILFCGKLIKLKGPDIAIEILYKLNIEYKNVRLHIIGDGSLRLDLEKKVNEYQLKKNIFFYGKQSQEFVLEQYKKSDIFLLPGRYDIETGRAETQGLVIQEAQAMKLPVVISDAGGAKYGIIPNKSGFVIKENDIDEFVYAIKQFLLKPSLIKNMGEAGRKNVVTNYDNNVLVKELIKIYES